MNPTVVKFLIAAAVLGSQLRKGYARRRPHWNQQSWKRFTGAIALVVIMFAVALLMAAAVDSGIYARLGASDLFRTAWVMTMMVLIIGGAVAGVALIGWFSSGEPSHPMPWTLRPSAWRSQPKGS